MIAEISPEREISSALQQVYICGYEPLWNANSDAVMKQQKMKGSMPELIC